MAFSRKLLPHLTAVGVISIILISYQNCSQRGFTTDSASLTDDRSGSGVTPPIDGEPVDPIPGSQAIVLSDYANGPAKTLFVKTATIYGKASGFGSGDTWGCAESINTSQCLSSTSAAWVKLPSATADWSFDASTGDWKMAASFADVPAGRYRVGFLDKSATAISNAPKFIEVDLRDPVSLVMSKSLNGPAVTTFKTNETGYFKLSGFGTEEVYGCAELLGSGACVESQFQKYPVNGWTFNSTDNTWRATLAMSNFPPGTYKMYYQDRARNLQHTATVQLSAATLTCRWDPGAVVGPCDYNANNLGLGSCSTANQGQTKSHAPTCGSNQSTCSCY